MVRRLLNDRRVAVAIACSIGAAFFFLMFDADLLHPTHIQWLLRNDDSRMQFIGWHSFRMEPWQVPPGDAHRYGMAMGSSIVFTDAVPLLALFFKIFDPLLPDKMQYMGGWLLACYVLQALMAWLLSGVMTTRLPQRLIVVALFVISPIMLNRVIAHHALVAHWLILGALYLYAKPVARHSGRWWCALIVTAALVNAYLLYMVLAVWSAYLIRRLWIDRDWAASEALRSTAITTIVLAGTMWMAGYFALPLRDFSGGAADYGAYALNLDALWNPLWFPTLAFSPRAVLPGTAMEASNYLGAGVMALALLALVPLFRLRQRGEGLRRQAPLVFVAVALVILAVSHQVRFDDRLLVAVSLPEFLRNMLGAIRSSARLVWVAYYGLILASVALVVQGFRPRVATAILAAALVIQVVDGAPRYLAVKRSYHEYFHGEDGAAMAKLTSPFWSVAAKHYQAIRFVSVANKPPGYDALALFAADHGMAINVGFFGRVSNERIAAANRELAQDIGSGQLRGDSLYVFWTADNGAGAGHAGTGDATGVIDGYRIVAPRWFAFDDTSDLRSQIHLNPRS